MVSIIYPELVNADNDPLAAASNPLYRILTQDNCTFTYTGTNHCMQGIFECLDCNLLKDYCCCTECALTCHRGHRCSLKHISPTAYCDCCVKTNCNSLQIGSTFFREKLFTKLIDNAPVLFEVPTFKGTHLLLFCIDQFTRQQKDQSKFRQELQRKISSDKNNKLKDASFIEMYQAEMKIKKLSDVDTGFKQNIIEVPQSSKSGKLSSMQSLFFVNSAEQYFSDVAFYYQDNKESKILAAVLQPPDFSEFALYQMLFKINVNAHCPKRLLRREKYAKKYSSIGYCHRSMKNHTKSIESVALHSLVKIQTFSESNQNAVQQLDTLMKYVTSDLKTTELLAHDIENNWSKQKLSEAEKSHLYTTIANSLSRLLGVYFSIGCHPLAFAQADEKAIEKSQAEVSNSARTVPYNRRRMDRMEERPLLSSNSYRRIREIDDYLSGRDMSSSEYVLFQECRDKKLKCPKKTTSSRLRHALQNTRKLLAALPIKFSIEAIITNAEALITPVRLGISRATKEVPMLNEPNIASNYITQIVACTLHRQTVMSTLNYNRLQAISTRFSSKTKNEIVDDQNLLAEHLDILSDPQYFLSQYDAYGDGLDDDVGDQDFSYSENSEMEEVDANEIMTDDSTASPLDEHREETIDPTEQAISEQISRMEDRLREEVSREEDERAFNEQNQVPVSPSDRGEITPFIDEPLENVDIMIGSPHPFTESTRRRMSHQQSISESQSIPIAHPPTDDDENSMQDDDHPTEIPPSENEEMTTDDDDFSHRSVTPVQNLVTVQRSRQANLSSRLPDTRPYERLQFSMQFPCPMTNADNSEMTDSRVIRDGGVLGRYNRASMVPSNQAITSRIDSNRRMIPNSVMPADIPTCFESTPDSLRREPRPMSSAYDTIANDPSSVGGFRLSGRQSALDREFQTRIQSRQLSRSRAFRENPNSTKTSVFVKSNDSAGKNVYNTQVILSRAYSLFLREACNLLELKSKNKTSSQISSLIELVDDKASNTFNWACSCMDMLESQLQHGEQQISNLGLASGAIGAPTSEKSQTMEAVFAFLGWSFQDRLYKKNKQKKSNSSFNDGFTNGKSADEQRKKFDRYIARQDQINYSLSLMRQATNDHENSVPVMMVSSLKHVAYVIDSFILWRLSSYDSFLNAGENIASSTPKKIPIHRRKFFKRSNSISIPGVDFNDLIDSDVHSTMPLVSSPGLLSSTATKQELFNDSQMDSNSPNQSTNLNSSLAFEEKTFSDLLLDNNGKLFDWVGRWFRILDVFTVAFQNDVALERKSVFQYLSDCGQSCDKIKKQLQSISELRIKDVPIRNLTRERFVFFKAVTTQLDKVIETDAVDSQSSGLKKLKVNYISEAGEGDGVSRSFLSHFAEELVSNEPIKANGKPIFKTVGNDCVVPVGELELEEQKLLVTVGRLFGLSLLNGWLFPLKLARPFVKLIIRREVRFHDLAFYDVEMYENFRKMLSDSIKPDKKGEIEALQLDFRMQLPQDEGGQVVSID